MSKWRENRLDHFFTLKRGHDLPSQLRVSGSVPIISSSGITGFHNATSVNGPGVVTGRYGTIGQVFYSEGDYWPLNTTLYVSEFNNELPKFVFYFLKSFDFDKFNDKSTVPGINRNHIHQEIVRFPPLPEQEAIAEVLSSLDDKIDLLHRNNKTLETMAETLFRQWFVEEADDSWEQTTLYDIIELVGGGTPKTENEEYWNGPIKWISAKDITPNHKGFIIKTEKSISESGLKHSSAKVLDKYSIIISARGTVGKYCLIAEPMTFSQSNYGIKPKHKGNNFFTYLVVANSVEELQSAAYGTVFDTITTKTFSELKLNVPPLDEIVKFENTIAPYFFKIEANTKQIHNLGNIRDTLLPKLMNGTLKVNNPVTA
jgi:type I restriction enzyme S subunit